MLFIYFRLEVITQNVPVDLECIVIVEQPLNLVMMSLHLKLVALQEIVDMIMDMDMVGFWDFYSMDMDITADTEVLLE
jgi:hypothetical protein